MSVVAVQGVSGVSTASGVSTRKERGWLTRGGSTQRLRDGSSWLLTRRRRVVVEVEEEEREREREREPGGLVEAGAEEEDRRHTPVARRR